MKKIKNTKIYLFFLKYIFIPIYSFFWEYIINFKGKIYKIIFCIKKKNSEYIRFESSSKKLVKDNSELKLLTKKINSQLSSEFIDEKINYIKSDEYKQEKKRGVNQAQAVSPYLLDIWDYMNEDLKREIVEFATSDFMIKTACNYLGVFPILTQIEINLNIPSGNQPRSAQLWHRDDLGYKSFNLFLALSKVDENNGPFITLKEKDPLNIFYRIKKEIDSGLTGERGKILDKDFNYFIHNNKNNNLLKLEGDPGTGLFIDTFRNYHKGGHCKTKHRLVLRFLYLTPDSLHNFEQEESLRKNNKKYLLSKDFFKNYLFRDRDKIISKFKIHEKLFKFYHMVSIKK